MNVLPVRLHPGDDLRDSIEAALHGHGQQAAFVIAGMGSLSRASLRFAAQAHASSLDEPLEILSLTGSVSMNGAHLHASVATETGRVVGGHVTRGCVVRTTAEILLVVLPEWRFDREHDAATGFAELVVSRAPGGDAGAST